MITRDDWEDLRDAVDNDEVNADHLDSEEEYAMQFDDYDSYYEGSIDSIASKRYEEMFYGPTEDD